MTEPGLLGLRTRTQEVIEWLGLEGFIISCFPIKQTRRLAGQCRIKIYPMFSIIKYNPLCVALF